MQVHETAAGEAAQRQKELEAALSAAREEARSVRLVTSSRPCHAQLSLIPPTPGACLSRTPHKPRLQLFRSFPLLAAQPTGSPPPPLHVNQSLS